MASDSTAPPPPGGGARYAIIGVVLAAVAGLVWCATRDEGEEPQATAGPPAATSVERSTSLVEQDLVIPDLEPDAGAAPDAGAIVAETHTKHSSTVVRAWDSCTGEIARADAQRVIQEFNAQIRNCYERRLKQNPALEGNMVLAVRVAHDGRVDGTQVSGSLHDREVFACVRQIASRMRFPPPGGRDCALVQVPYQFTPRR